jgi:hypothetical protein
MERVIAGFEEYLAKEQIESVYDLVGWFHKEGATYGSQRVEISTSSEPREAASGRCWQRWVGDSTFRPTPPLRQDSWEEGSTILTNPVSFSRVSV